jgi:prepilin-type N-terminal cleavage/methylation domain-containing protein
MKRKVGFTLVEMLTVIVIIAILAGMLFVVITRAKDSAKKGACQLDIHNLALALTQYEADHAQYPRDQYGAGTRLERSGQALWYGVSDWPDKPYYESNQKNTRNGRLVDRFGDWSTRGVWWYSFDNNDDDDGADPTAGDPTANAVRWNCTNVTKTKCDLWASGGDGVDEIWAAYQADSFVTGDNVASALAGTDAIGNW